MLTNVRGPCRERTAATLYGVGSKTGNIFPSTFEKPPDPSLGISKKPLEDAIVKPKTCSLPLLTNHLIPLRKVLRNDADDNGPLRGSSHSVSILSFLMSVTFYGGRPESARPPLRASLRHLCHEPPNMTCPATEPLTLDYQISIFGESNPRHPGDNE